MPKDNSSENPVILIDGSSYLYRAYHALPPLMNSKNQPTGAIRGVISMIKKILSDHPSSPLAVIFDAKGKTFRHEMYKEYKANRPPMPEDLVKQIEPINSIIKALGIKLLSVEGVEADDVIGTLANEASKLGLYTIISTGDKDMTQLVNEHIRVVNTMSGELLDENGVERKFGVKPELIIDYLSLVGDTSDNVPGIEKVGPKTAVKWLVDYGNLDKIIKNSEKIPGKVGENLRNGLDQLRLSRELVTIKKDVPLGALLKELEKTLLYHPDQCVGCPNFGLCKVCGISETKYDVDICVETKVTAHQVLSYECPFKSNCVISGSFPSNDFSPAMRDASTCLARSSAVFLVLGLPTAPPAALPRPAPPRTPP